MSKELTEAQALIDVRERQGKEKLNIVMNGQVLNMDQIVSSYYETLLWLENAAVELNYQVEDIGERLGLQTR